MTLATAPHGAGRWPHNRALVRGCRPTGRLTSAQCVTRADLLQRMAQLHDSLKTSLDRSAGKPLRCSSSDPLRRAFLHGGGMKHLTTWLGDNVWMLAAVIGGQGFKRNHTNLAGTEEVASDGRSGRSEEKWLNGASRPPSNAQRENRVAVNFAVIHCKLRCHATTLQRSQVGRGHGKPWDPCMGNHGRWWRQLAEPAELAFWRSDSDGFVVCERSNPEAADDA